MNSHKATFPLPRIKKPCARSAKSHDIVAGNLFGRKTNLFYRAFFSSEMHTKLEHIKNLKNLNIGTDRSMQTAYPDQTLQRTRE